MTDTPVPPAPHAHLGARPPADADPRPGGEGLPTVREAQRHAPGPKWYRLPEESWAMIRAEYLAGATAKQLGLKWGVSPTSIYRHACKAGWTKESRGEAINQEAVARFAARAAEAQARGQAQAQAQAAEAAREAREAEHEPADAAELLVRRAAAASLAGRVEEALSLLKTAEALRKAAAAAQPAVAAGWEEDPAGGCDYTDAEFERVAANLNRNLGLGGPPPDDEGAAGGGGALQPSPRP